MKFFTRNEFNPAYLLILIIDQQFKVSYYIVIECKFIYMCILLIDIKHSMKS